MQPGTPRTVLKGSGPSRTEVHGAPPPLESLDETHDQALATGALLHSGGRISGADSAARCDLGDETAATMREAIERLDAGDFVGARVLLAALLGERSPR
jgi:hypothetical protein